LSDRGRIRLLLALLAGIALAAAGISVWSLYQTAFNQQRAYLVEMVQSHARLIEAVARFNADFSATDYPNDSFAATLSQIVDAHQRYEGYGQTGEFTLARREGDDIVFLLSHRHYDLDNPRPVPWVSSLAEPMRRALSGLSGTVIGPDYRGVTVLAAHEPVATLDLGIVAKIDMAEVRRPFLQTAGGSGLAAMLMIALAVLLGRQISAPIMGREKAEAELRKLNDELERRVEKRTADLKAAQQELLRQERLATMGQLIATVSHELRNPLGTIKLSTSILHKTLKFDSQIAVRALGRLDRAVARCEAIVEELLDSTRTRRLKLEPTLVDDWLEEVLNEQVIPTNVQLRREFGLPNMSASLDREFFRRVVINVYDNACQAISGPHGQESDAREGVLTVRTQRDNDRIEVIFEDSGQGMRPEVHEKIFEPLFSTKNFGVGLGLPLVKQIMEQLGGGVEIESEEGRGTKVCLWFPYKHSNG
jgi:signal transduction histidine kinase